MSGVTDHGKLEFARVLRANRDRLGCTIQEYVLLLAQRTGIEIKFNQLQKWESLVPDNPAWNTLIALIDSQTLLIDRRPATWNSIVAILTEQPLINSDLRSNPTSLDRAIAPPIVARIQREFVERGLTFEQGFAEFQLCYLAGTEAAHLRSLLLGETPPTQDEQTELAIALQQFLHLGEHKQAAIGLDRGAVC